MCPSELDIRHIEDLQWMVVRTRSRCEKKLQSFCETRGITSYLPLRRSIKRYQNRVREFQVPIFTGYVFCQISYNDMTIVNECQYTAHILRPPKDMEYQLISELRSIQIFEGAMLEGEITVKPEIQVGASVIIKTGPMAGLNGIVTRWKNKVRLTVNVEMVGQAVSIEIDAGEVDIDF